MCRRLAGNEADALDATQEALIAIARGIRRFDGRRPSRPGPTGWPPTPASTSCGGASDARSPGSPTTSATGDHQRPRRRAHATGIEVLPDRLAIDAALEQLPEEFRAPVVLRDLCDLDYAEIA